MLVAEDNLTNTRVEYAAAGKGLNTAGSYVPVPGGTINHEQVIAMSGGALLTAVNGSITGNVRIRFFNGTKFGPAHAVPQPAHPDDGNFALEATGSITHVFFIAKRQGYDLLHETTATGATWTPLQSYSSAIASALLSPVLNRFSNGVVFENDGHPLYAQPILQGLHVHMALHPSVVRVGHSALLTGASNPCGGAHRVTLEKLVAGKWYPVRSITTSTCAIKFGVPGATATYRAVVSWLPGWNQYGYSNAATLTALP